MTAAKKTSAAPVSGLAPQTRVLYKVKLDHLDMIDQVRTTTGLTKASIDELADSMTAHGQMQPILVRPNLPETTVDGKTIDRYTVTAGHRRVMAARAAGWTEIDALIDDEDSNPNDDNITVQQLIENVQREDLSTTEIGAALRKIYDSKTDITLDGLGKMVGKSKPWISKRLSPTFPDFSAFAKLAMDEGTIGDIEIIHLFNQADKAGAPTERLMALKADIVAGTKSRKEAKDFLDDVKKGVFKTAEPATPPAAVVSDAGAAGPQAQDPKASNGAASTRPETGKTPAAAEVKKIDLSTAVDVIEARMRTGTYKPAQEYADSLPTSMLLDMCQLVAVDFERGRLYANENPETKLHALAQYAATNGGEMNLAAFVNGATKRGNTFPDLMRAMKAMGKTQEAAQTNEPASGK